MGGLDNFDPILVYIIFGIIFVAACGWIWSELCYGECCCRPEADAEHPQVSP